MTKKEKFLNELNIKLNNNKHKEEIINTYNFFIDNRLESGIKITEILNEIGNIDEVIKKELLKYSKRDKITQWVSKIRKKIIKTFGLLKDKIKEKTDSIKIKINKFNSSFKVKAKKINLQKKFKRRAKKAGKVKQELKRKIIVRKKNKYNWLIFLLEIIIFIVLFYALIILAASLFALLDGVKMLGISFIFIGIVALLILGLSFLNKKRLILPINHNLYFVSLILIIVFLSFSVGYSTYNYFDINYVDNISEKYNYIIQTFEYRFPNKEKKLHIYFNSWYKNDYIIEYDDKLDNRIKIDVKYYEAFYDLQTARESCNIYISLGFDFRDMVSLYLDNLKEKKIYNEKEFSRYIIKIYVNEKDVERLIIHN